MKTLGFILSLVVFTLIGILPMIAVLLCVDPATPTLIESISAYYIGAFLGANIFSAIYYSDKFYKWYKSNLN